MASNKKEKLKKIQVQEEKTKIEIFPDEKVYLKSLEDILNISMMDRYKPIKSEKGDDLDDFELDLSNIGLGIKNLEDIIPLCSKFPSRLKKLNLSRCMLLDLPESLSTCENIHILDISFNLFPIFPSMILQMNHLDHIILDNNFFECLDIPGPVSDNLQKVLLKNCGIKKISESIVYLSKVKHLDISSNELEQLPDCFNQLKELIYLDLSYNKFSFFPSALLAMDKLEAVFLSRNEIIDFPGEFCASESRKVNFKKLDLSYNKISSIPEEIGNLSQLTQLYLNELPLEGLLPDSICELKKLEELGLQHIGLKELPENIGDLKDLKTLNISLNDLKDFPESFHNLIHMEYLFLDSNQFSDIPGYFADFKDIWTITADGNNLRMLPESFQNFESLDEAYKKETNKEKWRLFRFNCNFISKIPCYFYKKYCDGIYEIANIPLLYLKKINMLSAFSDNSDLKKIIHEPLLNAQQQQDIITRHFSTDEGRRKFWEYVAKADSNNMLYAWRVRLYYVDTERNERREIMNTGIHRIDILDRKGTNITLQCVVQSIQMELFPLIKTVTLFLTSDYGDNNELKFTNFYFENPRKYKTRPEKEDEKRLKGREGIDYGGWEYLIDTFTELEYQDEITFKIAPEYSMAPLAILKIKGIHIEFQDNFLAPESRQDSISGVYKSFDAFTKKIMPTKQDSQVFSRPFVISESNNDDKSRWLAIFETFKQMWKQPTFATIELKMGKHLALFGKYIENMYANIIFASSIPSVIALILKLAKVSFISADFLGLGVLSWGEFIGYVPIAIFIVGITIKFLIDQVSPLLAKKKGNRVDWYYDDNTDIK